MRRSTKKKIILVTALLFIVAAVCTLPLPIEINVQMIGIELAEDGTPMDDYTVNLQGWKRDYLFREDTMKVDVQIHGPSSLNLEGIYHTTIFQDNPEYDFADFMVYFAVSKDIGFLSLYLGKDLSWSMITVNDRQFVVSADPNADLQEYWKMCLD